MTGVAVTDGDCVNECDECDVGEGLLCVAKRCSISCSCCSALTKAVFSRFVCSAFSAFFTLVVTHCSQIIFESLPTEERKGGATMCEMHAMELAAI